MTVEKDCHSVFLLINNTCKRKEEMLANPNSRHTAPRSHQASSTKVIVAVALLSLLLLLFVVVSRTQFVLLLFFHLFLFLLLLHNVTIAGQRPNPRAHGAVSSTRSSLWQRSVRCRSYIVYRSHTRSMSSYTMQVPKRITHRVYHQEMQKRANG